MANKLELTWYGKDEPIRVEPRLLIENAALSNTASDPDTQNMLIHGDNLLALKALESKYAGQVKCIYIDPPYNTGSAFEHYDDNLEHSQWLNLMRPRLETLKTLLAQDGSIWISIDDDEGHYLKVLCDEIFGRNNFVNTVIWEKKYAPQGNAQWFTDSHDFVLVYARNKATWCPNLLPRSNSMNAKYKNPDCDPKGPWRPDNATISLSGGQRGAQYARTGYCENIYELKAPNGKTYLPPQGRCWYYPEKRMMEAIAEGKIFFGKNGQGAPQLKRYMSEVKQGATAMTIWKRDEVGDNQEAKREVRSFNAESVFATPKPERLIERILTLATNPGDLILDSFLGSGTTAAVAQKMGRRWIGVEMGDHAYTHCKVRLDKVIAGQDPGGITKAQNWHGGGGYRFYEVAPTLINKDPFDEYVINEAHDADMLAAAVALHEGFRYQPDSSLFWKQSVGNESSYLFVTTRHLNSTYLDSIKDTMEEGEYLIIACRSFDCGLDKAYGNITVKKIPQMLLDRCEFGKTDYNLNIVHPPVYDDEAEEEEQDE
ncbi:MAG: site-specific DNA-methyltransferase [Peptoniphilaceae bacterium]|nr:site-specific DNA-methyltransferase [Peptoniphilaceae bacterium]